MVKSFVQDHPTGKRQRHTPSLLTLSLYPLHTSVCISGFKTCDWIWVFKFSFCSGPYIFTSNSTHLRPCHSGPVFVCKLYVCMEHLSVLHAVSQHQETQARVRILANNVCKCVLIIFTFTWTLAMDDQEEERKTSLDGRIWWWATVSSLPVAWEYQFKRQWETFRNNRWKKNSSLLNPRGQWITEA